MRIDAFLCDAATVRENLLHVLGGGITRLWRNRFPAQMSVALAMMVQMRPGELGMPHSLQIQVTGADGEPIAAVGGEFSSDANPNLIPGESTNVPLVINLHDVLLPMPGQYGITVVVDRQEKLALSVLAVMTDPPGETPAVTDGS